MVREQWILEGSGVPVMVMTTVEIVETENCK